MIQRIRKFCLVAVASVLVACGGSGDDTVTGTVDVQQIQPLVAGATKLGSQDYAVVLRSNAEWNAFWAAHTEALVPYVVADVDFSRYAVAAIVFQDSRPAATLAVKSIDVQGELATISYARPCVGGSSCTGGVPVLRALSAFLLVPNQVKTLQLTLVTG